MFAGMLAPYYTSWNISCHFCFALRAISEENALKWIQNEMDFFSRMQ